MMNTPFPTASPSLLRKLTFAISVPLITISLHAQQSEARADDNEGAILTLSPFTVEADQIEGYRATTTLAGTRINSSLRDIASSISVYTKEFMEDTGSTNLTELLVYATGTEVSGMGGNLTTQNTNNFNMTFDDERFRANSTTRVRGLANADNTRNYFSSIVPLDSYNTSRVTINRGEQHSVRFGQSGRDN